MKSLIVASFLVLSVIAVTEASPGWYWGPLKLGPKHEWVEGYGYAIPQAEKSAAERKKREADPGVYGYYGYLPYHHGYKPANIKMEDVDYGKTGIKYNVKKRSAEADPEADPGFLAYGYPYVPYIPYVPLTVEPRNPTAYGYSAGAKVVVAEPKTVEKRDAEADPEADPGLLAYHPYAYTYPYYVLPKVTARNPQAFGYSAGEVTVSYPGLAKPAEERKKREAEANPEADPGLLAYHPYAYTYPYYGVHYVLADTPTDQKLTPDAYGYAAGLKATE